MAMDRNLPGSEKWSDMRPHEEFLELCAVATSGELADEEQQRLRDHLAGCAECRQALSEFEAVADRGVPLLAPALCSPAFVQLQGAPKEGVEITSASAPGQLESGRSISIATPHDKWSRLALRNGHRHAQLHSNYVWMPLAAAVVLAAALGLYSFEVGRRRSPEVVQMVPSSRDYKPEALERGLSDAGHEREVLMAQLAERNRVVADLRRELERQSAALKEMKNAQAGLEQSLQADDAEKQRVAQERGTLSQRLDAATASMQRTQAEFDALRELRTRDQLRVADLDGQIKDLTAQLKDRDQTIVHRDELLAHDQDIRELMGARELYIAEVYDVARDGATQKPYGRVFYTKGKSLIFYAYDLDQQPGVRNASTFQAWGQRGADRQRPLNLGIFYEDNEAKKRWVLKFDDPRSLEQIDAVFVTVEPNGGSHKPSGKPLLYAYLKVNPNHP